MNLEILTKSLSKGAEGLGKHYERKTALDIAKKDKKEAKRRTLAQLLNSAMRRNRSLSKAGQDQSDEMNEYRTQSLQNMARGFAEALQGSTNRGLK